jgi:hypothetical protein
VRFCVGERVRVRHEWGESDEDGNVKQANVQPSFCRVRVSYRVLNRWRRMRSFLAYLVLSGW